MACYDWRMSPFSNVGTDGNHLANVRPGLLVPVLCRMRIQSARSSIVACLMQTLLPEL